MLEGIPRAKEKLRNLTDHKGQPPIFTWCLRVDYQVKSIHGSYSAILEKHADFLRSLEDTGDELAWHPHFWNFDSKRNQWYQEVDDVDWQVNMLREAHAAYISMLPGRARSVRMGWDYHNNDTFATLEELGVEVDFSGIPGIQILPRKNNQGGENFYDWYLSPNRPYYPAINDYRSEADRKEEACTLLESPNFVSESFLWGLFRGAVMAKKMKDPMQIFRAIRRPTYWIGITGKPFFFMPLIAQVDRTLRKHNSVVFVTYFHPDELLENKHKMYSLEFMEENLWLLSQYASRWKARIEYLRASDIKRLVQGDLS